MAIDAGPLYSLYVVYHQMDMNHRINVNEKYTNALGGATCLATFPNILLNTNYCWMRDRFCGGVRFFGPLRILKKIDGK
jgi:hypothetical protein